MKRLMSVVCHLLVATAVAGLWARAPSGAVGNTNPGTASRDVLQAKLRDIEQEIDRLDQAGRSDQARRFQEELDRIKRRLDGQYPAAESDQPELHWLGIGQGSTAPPGVLKGPARFSTGYAEVQVTYRAHPVVLVLYGRDHPIHWHVSAKPGVRLRAVILSGKVPRRVAGLPKGVLVFGQIDDSPHEYAASMSSSTLGQGFEHFTGLHTATRVYQARYLGTPVVLGPENDTWRWEHNMAPLADLHKRAMQSRRDREAKAVGGVKFEGIYFTKGPAGTTAAVGEYTPLGPITQTLKPLDHELRLTVADEKSSTTFALNHHWNLVVAERTADGYPEVPLRADMPARCRFEGMVLDTKRHRLVLAPQKATTPLFAYDLNTAQWVDLAELPSRLRSLVYAAEEDVLYGLAESSEFPHPYVRRIDHVLRLAPDGEVLEKIPLASAIHIGGCEAGAMQMIHVDGTLVVLFPPGNPDPHAPPGGSPTVPWPSHAMVVDATTGEMIYRGVQCPHDGRGNVLIDVQSTPDRPPPGGLLAELWKKLNAAEDWIKALRERGDEEAARRSTETLNLLREQLKGEYRVQQEAPVQLHYVGFSSQGNPVIQVTDKSRPIVLALSGYEPVRWSVKAAPGVKLEKVVIGGQYQQFLDEVPKGVPVETHTNEDRDACAFSGTSRHPRYYPRLVNQLRRLTGLEIATFYGDRDPPRTPLVLGPENAEWRIQQVMFDLDRLFQAAQRQEREKHLKRLDKLDFHAIHYSIPPQPSDAAQRYGAEQPEAAWGQFTPRGPIVSTLKPIPNNVHALAVDPKGPIFYARQSGAVFEIDLETAQRFEIPVSGVPRFSWPSGLAFDSERRRLLLNSGNYLYAYLVDQGQWTVLRRPGLGGGPLCYALEKDMLYTVQPTHGGHASLITLNADGAVLHQVKVPKQLGLHDPGRRFQLCYSREHLIFLGPMITDPEDPARQRDQVTVINPETGEILYEGLSRPCTD